MTPIVCKKIDGQIYYCLDCGDYEKRVPEKVWEKIKYQTNQKKRDYIWHCGKRFGNKEKRTIRESRIGEPGRGDVPATAP